MASKFWCFLLSPGNVCAVNVTGPPERWGLHTGCMGAFKANQTFVWILVPTNTCSWGPGVIYLKSLCLSFPICKMKIIIHFPWGGFNNEVKYAHSDHALDNNNGSNTKIVIFHNPFIWREWKYLCINLEVLSLPRFHNKCFQLCIHICTIPDYSIILINGLTCLYYLPY